MFGIGMGGGLQNGGYYPPSISFITPSTALYLRNIYLHAAVFTGKKDCYPIPLKHIHHLGQYHDRELRHADIDRLIHALW